MRKRRAANEQVAEVARRRLELLSAELAGIRGEQTEPEYPPAPEAAPESVPGPPGRHAQRPVRLPRRVGGWVRDRLPPTLQGTVDLGAAHLAVVALLVAAALGATAWWVARAEPENSTVLPVVPRVTSSASPLGPAPVPVEASATPTPRPSAERGSIVVDVAGKVRRPGIVTLPVGSRVFEAVEAAGGARKGVRLVALNLARRLVDGEQVVVGIPPPEGVAASAASAPRPGGTTAGPLVNLNTATQTDLETLPGVGPVTAESILAWRAGNGAFSAVDELLEVSGIGDKTLAEIAPFVTL